MAGDWLKVEISTPDKAEVWQIANDLSIDPDAVVGKIIRVWGWFDQHTEDGNAPSVSKTLLDRLVCVSGFVDSMVKAGWMIEGKDFLTMPNFDNHNGQSAKKRANTARRVAKHSKTKKGTNAESVKELTQPALGRALAREEKRREENNKSIVGQAPQVLDYLNKTCSSNFRPVDANIKLINARFKEGYTIDDVKSVIDSKSQEWLDTEQAQFLRPKTLFAAANFSNYHGQIGVKKTGKAKPATDFWKLSESEQLALAERVGVSTIGRSPKEIAAAVQRAQQ